MSRMLCLLLLCLLIHEGFSAPQVCIARTCENGQYCTGNTCVPCPNGEYQNVPVHSQVSCKPWTTKPVGAHWVLEKEGTASTDRIWRCADGYEEMEISPGEVQCIVKSTTTTTTTTIAMTVAKATSSQKVETTTLVPPPEKNKDPNVKEIIIGVVVALVVVLALAGFLIWCKCRKPKDGVDNSLMQNVPENDLETPLMKMTSSETQTSGINKVERSLPPGIDFPFLHYYVKRLGANATEKLFHFLPQQEGNNIMTDLSFERKKNPTPEIYFTTSLLAWVENNPKLDHKNALLTALEKAELTHCIEPEKLEVLRKHRSLSNGDSAQDAAGGSPFGSLGMAPMGEEGSATQVKVLMENGDSVSQGGSPADAGQAHGETGLENRNICTQEIHSDSAETLCKTTIRESTFISDISTQQVATLAERGPVSESQASQRTSGLTSGSDQPSLDTTVPSNNGKIQVNLYPVYHHIAGKLTPEERDMLLYRLPNSSHLFNVRNCFDMKLKEGKAPDISFVETLGEWAMRNPKVNRVAAGEYLKDLLTELGRGDIVEDELVSSLGK